MQIFGWWIRVKVARSGNNKHTVSKISVSKKFGFTWQMCRKVYDLILIFSKYHLKVYISPHLLSCGGALLFIDSAALTLINSAALLLISVKTRIIREKQLKLTHTWCYISAHTLAHWNIDQCLIGSSPGYNSGENASLSGIKGRQSLFVSILTLEGEAKGWGTLRVEVTRRREMRRDT